MDRRAYLASLGSAAASLTALAGCTGAGGPDVGDWTAVDAPVQTTLHAVVSTVDGPYAVGEGGRVFARHGGEWDEVVAAGPRGTGNDLVDAAVTENGRAVWVCGADGVAAAYDVVADRLTDYSAPDGHTSSWSSVSVTGLRGRERVYLANSSGELLVGANDGGLTWADDVREPGGGASVGALDFDRHGFGYVCDTTGGVYESVDAGGSWRTVGISGASVDLHDLAPVRRHAVTVAGGDGRLFRFDGFDWFARDLGEQALRAVERTRRSGAACGGNGTVAELTPDGWRLAPADVDAGLRDVLLPTPDYPGLAVGNGGTVLARR